jgi:hypothetical protein
VQPRLKALQATPEAAAASVTFSAASTQLKADDLLEMTAARRTPPEESAGDGGWGGTPAFAANATRQHGVQALSDERGLIQGRVRRSFGVR